MAKPYKVDELKGWNNKVLHRTEHFIFGQMPKDGSNSCVRCGTGLKRASMISISSNPNRYDPDDAIRTGYDRRGSELRWAQFADTATTLDPKTDRDIEHTDFPKGTYCENCTNERSDIQ